MTDIITPTPVRVSDNSNGTTIATSFKKFLEDWDVGYKNKIKDIDLFNAEVISKYSNEQRSYVVKIFYHSRGHFKDFLWHLGNHAPSKVIKDIILKNIERAYLFQSAP